MDFGPNQGDAGREEEDDASEIKLGAGEQDPPERVLGAGDGERDGSGNRDEADNLDGATWRGEVAAGNERCPSVGDATKQLGDEKRICADILI